MEEEKFEETPKLLVSSRKAFNFVRALYEGIHGYEPRWDKLHNLLHETTYKNAQMWRLELAQLEREHNRYKQPSLRNEFSRLIKVFETEQRLWLVREAHHLNRVLNDELSSWGPVQFNGCTIDWFTVLSIQDFVNCPEPEANEREPLCNSCLTRMCETACSVLSQYETLLRVDRTASDDAAIQEAFVFHDFRDRPRRFQKHEILSVLDAITEKQHLLCVSDIVDRNDLLAEFEDGLVAAFSDESKFLRSILPERRAVQKKVKGVSGTGGVRSTGDVEGIKGIKDIKGTEETRVRVMTRAAKRKVDSSE
jgi:hypothetical protein